MDSLDPARVATIRSLILSAIRRCGPTDAILLSGGLDTCILAQAWPMADPATQPKLAVTVLAAPEATDAPYAKAIAQTLGMEHSCISLDSPIKLVQDQELLDFVVGVLGSFDPMEIRNSLAIAKALLECQAQGLRTVATGDGADELFAGYSFVRSMSEEDLHKYTCHLTTIWRFAAVPLGQALGIKVVQPFLDSQVVEFALSCKRSELINTHNDREHGKFILRAAFPNFHSSWRRKDPIEVGSGTTLLPSLLAAAASSSPDMTPAATQHAFSQTLASETQRIKQTHDIVIRDTEHLAYFHAFERIHLHNRQAEDGDSGAARSWMPAALPERFGSDPCRECKYQLKTSETKFCVVCGAWPARD